MQKSIHIFSICLIAFLLAACCSASQVTQTPAESTAPPSQPPAVIIPSQAIPTADPAQLPLAEPAGLKVAFVLEGNIWFWSETTPAVQLTTDGEAGWMRLSDDGQLIVFTRGQSLWAMNRDGSNVRPLVDVQAHTGRTMLAQLEFQPNSHIVYFSTLESIQGQVGSDLHRVDADAATPSAQTVLLKDGGRFTFSPDGRLLALATTERISILRFDTTGLIVSLTYPKVNTSADWAFYPQVVWLDNSTGFYTVIPGAELGQKARFLYVSADAAFSAQLAEFAIADLRISQPVIAPNGSKVAYMTATGEAFDIHVIDASTADVLIGTYPHSPQYGLWAWSPDSERFTYWTEDPSRLLIAGVTNPPVPILEIAAPYSLTWVDPNRFLYIADGELRLGQAGNPLLSVIASGYWPSQQGSPFDFAP